MYIYNVTINIAAAINHQWLNWMKEKHILDVMNTGCFIDYQIAKLLFVEDEGTTYSIQYKFLEMKDFDKYQNEFAKNLQEDHKKMFEGHFNAFRTILEIIN